ncbi:hypothetical protein SAMN04487890_115112 [Mucilaginibacter polytrichastri]|nr:hypothetical protein SAMN04487890_115112 [Mucilaginibacter polytrichastri]
MPTAAPALNMPPTTAQLLNNIIASANNNTGKRFISVLNKVMFQ